jgi:putative transposase
VFVTSTGGVFDDSMLTRCEQVMREVCTDFGAEHASSTRT